MRKSHLTIIIMIISLGLTASAHSGRTDKYGGHWDYSTGTYHYHSGEHAGETFNISPRGETAPPSRHHYPSTSQPSPPEKEAEAIISKLEEKSEHAAVDHYRSSYKPGSDTGHNDVKDETSPFDAFREKAALAWRKTIKPAILDLLSIMAAVIMIAIAILALPLSIVMLALMIPSALIIVAYPIYIIYKIIYTIVDIIKYIISGR